MRNRWFHRPLFHPSKLGDEKKATWLELFFDLIFVAAFIQLGNGLSEHVSVEGFLGFAGIFIPLWLAWTGFTYYVNRFTVDDFVHRILVFIQMFAVGAMAVTGPGVFEGQTRSFALAYAVAQGMVTVMYVRAWKQVPDVRDYSRYWGSVFAFGTVTWLVSAFVPAPICYVLWALGIGGIFASPVSKSSRALAERYPADWEHLSERYGLLTIIVLGESFVKVLSTLSSEGAGLSVVLQAIVALLIISGIWWIYFDDVAGSRIKQQRFAPTIWVYSHLPLHIAVTATGVAIKKAVHFETAASADPKYAWLLSGTIGLTVLSVAIIDSVTERRQAELSDRIRVNVRAATAVMLIVLAPISGTMTAGLFLGLVTTLCVAQVVFDMMMAPLEASDVHEGKVETVAEIARRRVEDHDYAGQRPRRDVSETIRMGAPSELRRDIYFFFMEGGWRRLFLALAFLYIVVNVFFAALYLLEPGSIATARPSSFGDAFFFSVQTMSTIGFGTLSPATTYGDVIVTIEAAVGLLGVALATGVMFAKASRPTQSVLFSRPLVVTQLHGTPTLMFRVGNTRGNEIVDATISLTVLKDEISREGLHLRRLHDLELTRNRSPLFALSWTVMHPISGDSPLCDVDWGRPYASVERIIATLVGHDGTYGQTVYARHIYYPEDIRSEERFVDVISELEDGRLMIDYRRFHDTEPSDEGATEA